MSAVVHRPTGGSGDLPISRVGNTAIIDLSRFAKPGSARVFAKCEQRGVTGSIHDRVVKSWVQAWAQNSTETKVLTAAVAGDFAVSLAILGRMAGFSTKLVVSTELSRQRLALLRGVGAAIVRAEAGQCEDKAAELGQAPGHLHVTPPDFAEVRRIHAETTGRELAQSLSRCDAVVCGDRTLGLVCGLSDALSAEAKSHQSYAVVAADPRSGQTDRDAEIEPLPFASAAKHLIGETALSLRISAITPAQAYLAHQMLAQKCGLLVGLPSAANVAAALQVAETLGSECVVATVLTETGERHFHLSDRFGEAAVAT